MKNKYIDWEDVNIIININELKYQRGLIVQKEESNPDQMTCKSKEYKKH